MTLGASRRSSSSPEVERTGRIRNRGQRGAWTERLGERTLEVDEVETHQAERETCKDTAQEDEDDAEAKLPVERWRGAPR